MTTSIVYGGAALVRENGQHPASIRESTGIYQTEGIIREIGPIADLRRKYPGVRETGSESDILLPGLVNAHHHVGITSLQLGTFDQPLETTFAARLAHRDVDPYLDTLHSAFELVGSGVTTVQHLHNPRRGSSAQWGPAAEQILEAYRTIGIRVAYSFMVRVQNRIVYGDDDAFVAMLPPSLRQPAQAHLDGYSVTLQTFIEHFKGLYEKYAGGPRIAIQLAPGNLHWCSDEALIELTAVAKSYGVGMHMHLLETAYQQAYAHRTKGKSAVAHLRDLGVLGSHLTLGHCVWCNERDIDIIAETGTMVCHLPSSNLRLHNGIAPLCAFLDRGVTVALGIDECTLNDDRDMLFEMRLASKLHRVPGIRSRYPTAREIVAMATEGGAKTTPFAGIVGTLAEGYAADCVLIDRKSLGYPYLDESVPVLEAILYRAKPAHVNTVIVGGEVIFRNGTFTCVNAAAVRDELAQQLGRPLREEDRKRRAFAEALVPYVGRFYDGWLDRAPFDPPADTKEGSYT